MPSMLSAVTSSRGKALVASTAAKASRSKPLAAVAASASTVGLGLILTAAAAAATAASLSDQNVRKGDGGGGDEEQAQQDGGGRILRGVGVHPIPSRQRRQNLDSSSPIVVMRRGIVPVSQPCVCDSSSSVVPPSATSAPLGDDAASTNGSGSSDGSVEKAEQQRMPTPIVRNITRHRTLRRINSTATRKSVSSLYEIEHPPLGEGSYGEVFQARHKPTGEILALKKISKEFTDEVEFQREMNALLHVRACGGHPNICMLRENFNERHHFVLILDLIRGGEMFDVLIENGAYSEADAARLVRQVASALSFMHGIGVVHADLKPENLMLSSKNKDEAAIKVVDFGCAEILPEEWGDGPPLDGGDGTDDEAVQTALLLPSRVISPGRVGGTTPAYCPPEAFDGLGLDGDGPGTPIRPSMDMWSLGIIIYIMLTGLHPFDLNSDLTDEEIEKEIRTLRTPPLDGSPYTQHLSPSAIDLLSKLMTSDPKTRLTAHEMLAHPWVRGDTARDDIIAGSDEKLSKIRHFRSKIEAKVFANLIHWSDHDGRRDAANAGTSLLEKAFSSLDEEKKGFVTMEDVAKFVGGTVTATGGEEGSGSAGDDCLHGEASGQTSLDAQMPMSGFSDLVGENMQSMHFPRGHVVFAEGDPGDYMYFINSGTVEVSTRDGFRAKLGQGDSFGEGSLLRPGARRSATLRCATPVHAIRVDKEYFKKYLSSSESVMALKLREKVNTRNFGRAEFIFGQQEDLDDVQVGKGERIFGVGDHADNCYIVDDGAVQVRATSGKSIYRVGPGDLFGVQSLVMNRPRKASAVCVSDTCKLRSMDYRKFNALSQSSKPLKKSLHDMCFRREFKRAVVLRTRKSFPRASGLKQAFDDVDVDGSGDISHEEMREVLTHLDKSLSEEQIKDLIQSMDLNDSGNINFEEFKSVFGRT